VDPLIRDISDTARWVAMYRAQETDRPDAVFRDPLARRLAGERGAQIVSALPWFQEASWSFTARTHLVDKYIDSGVNKGGVDQVINLAAGLDARPYRMDLPSTLRWVEVDLPDILDYKEEILADAMPSCAVERVRLDLSNEDARRGLFTRLGARSSHTLVIAEGLLIYLMRDDVRQLARDIAAVPSLRHWIVDICSPGLLAMLMERMGDVVREAGAPYLFAPPEGPAFFEQGGWKAIDVRSLLKTARRLDRLPLFLKMMAMLPESGGPQGSRPWAAVCLLERQA
jgi:methyltransferase (TIGR00027 family)